MSSVTFNYGHWNYWGVYDPSNDLYGDQKVTFDGVNKLILVNEGVTSLNVQTDVYSAWKEWIKDPNLINSKYIKVFTVIGGDPITDDRNVGITYFLENGWRFQPKPTKTSYTLTIEGNIYTRETGETPFLFAEGVSVSLVRSNIVDLIRVEALGVNITANDIAAIAAASASDVWDEPLSSHTTRGTTGQKQNKIATKVQDIALR